MDIFWKCTMGFMRRPRAPFKFQMSINYSSYGSHLPSPPLPFPQPPKHITNGIYTTCKNVSNIIGLIFIYYIYFSFFIFLTATSDGTESNLNSTRGGHCDDTVNNIYMKLEVYVCQSTGKEMSSNKYAALYSGQLHVHHETFILQGPVVRSPIKLILG